jgi:hypothetical protein
MTENNQQQMRLPPATKNNLKHNYGARGESEYQHYNSKIKNNPLSQRLVFETESDKKDREYNNLILECGRNASMEAVRNHFGIDRLNRQQRRTPDGKKVMAGYNEEVSKIEKEFSRRWKEINTPKINTQIVSEHQVPISSLQHHTLRGMPTSFVHVDTGFQTP